LRFIFAVVKAQNASSGLIRPIFLPGGEDQRRR
jgi:hypothetical protein